jgi:predicted SnoaL-like aldol condensation-catalyzing enzyme
MYASYKQHNPAFRKRSEDAKISDCQDPTAAPGKFYEVFTFDTFRVRNGKLVEHWDGAVINPPAPAAGGRG